MPLQSVYVQHSLSNISVLLKIIIITEITPVLNCAKVTCVDSSPTLTVDTSVSYFIM